jgi:hypothetical protein
LPPGRGAAAIAELVARRRRGAAAGPRQRDQVDASSASSAQIDDARRDLPPPDRCAERVERTCIRDGSWRGAYDPAQAPRVPGARSGAIGRRRPAGRRRRAAGARASSASAAVASCWRRPEHHRGAAVIVTEVFEVALGPGEQRGPMATDAAFRRFEQQLGAELPDDYQALSQRSRRS